MSRPRHESFARNTWSRWLCKPAATRTDCASGSSGIKPRWTTPICRKSWADTASSNGGHNGRLDSRGLAPPGREGDPPPLVGHFAFSREGPYRAAAPGDGGPPLAGARPSCARLAGRDPPPPAITLCEAVARGLRGHVLQYDILTTVAGGQTVGRRKNVSGIVVGAGAGPAHLRERVERAAADHGFDLKMIAECLGADCARASRTWSRGGERRSAARMLDCKTGPREIQP